MGSRWTLVQAKLNFFLGFCSFAFCESNFVRPAWRAIYLQMLDIQAVINTSVNHFKALPFSFPELQAFPELIAKSFTRFEFNFQPVKLFQRQLHMPFLISSFSRIIKKVVSPVGNWSVSIPANLVMLLWEKHGRFSQSTFWWNVCHRLNSLW